MNTLNSLSSTRERILADAKINGETGGEEIPGVTDQFGQKWTKLDSYEDLMTVYDLLTDDHKKAATQQKKKITAEIKGGVTFGFYFRDGKLWFER